MKTVKHSIFAFVMLVSSCGITYRVWDEIPDVIDPPEDRFALQHEERPSRQTDPVWLDCGTPAAVESVQPNLQPETE